MTFKLRKTGSALFNTAVLTLASVVAAVAVTLAGTVTASAGTILGDADCDGTVSIKDVTAIQMVLAELPLKDSFSESAADVDKNEVVDISDATHIQLWLASLENLYPIGGELEQSTETTAEATVEPTSELITEQPTEPATKITTCPPTQPLTDDDGWGRVIFKP